MRYALWCAYLYIGGNVTRGIVKLDEGGERGGREGAGLQRRAREGDQAARLSKILRVRAVLRTFLCLAEVLL